MESSRTYGHDGKECSEGVQKQHSKVTVIVKERLGAIRVKKRDNERYVVWSVYRIVAALTTGTGATRSRGILPIPGKPGWGYRSYSS